MAHYIKAWEIVGVATEDGDLLCADCARKAKIDLSESGDERVIFASEEAAEDDCTECGQTLIDSY